MKHGLLQKESADLKDHLSGFNKRLRQIIQIHLHPSNGSPYWLMRQKTLGIDIARTIKSEDDLFKLGLMPLSDLNRYPVEFFIPKCFIASRRPYLTASTGGRTGKPKFTAYFKDEFRRIFVDNFIDATHRTGIPKTTQWLWIGPGGPHIIGKAAHEIALKLSGKDPFSIDFDPRWFRKLAEGSMARRRYMEHLLAQSAEVLDSQMIDALFSTPAVVKLLAKAMILETRKQIKVLYLGGMSVTSNDVRTLKQQFPSAHIFSGYGNTLFGVCDSYLNLAESDSPPAYGVPAKRLHIKLIESEDAAPEPEELNNTVPAGQRGRVVFHRLDESFFLPNVCESDTAVSDSQGQIYDPQPLIKKGFKVQAGIY